MSEPTSPIRPGRWLGPTIVILLAAQLCLVWLHGSLLNRQHQDLQDIRSEIANLSDTIAEGQDDSSQEDEALSPALDLAVRPGHRVSRRLHHPRARFVRVQDEGQDAEGRNRELDELRKSQQSGQEAVAKGKKVRSILSIEENARKAEAKDKALGITRSWIPGIVAVLAALGFVFWRLRRRA
jgi:hypothetical protein